MPLDDILDPQAVHHDADKMIEQGYPATTGQAFILIPRLKRHRHAFAKALILTEIIKATGIGDGPGQNIVHGHTVRPVGGSLTGCGDHWRDDRVRHVVDMNFRRFRQHGSAHFMNPLAWLKPASRSLWESDDDLGRCFGIGGDAEGLVQFVERDTMAD